MTGTVQVANEHKYPASHRQVMDETRDGRDEGKWASGEMQVSYAE